jgi:hypothetical protein
VDFFEAVRPGLVPVRFSSGSSKLMYCAKKSAL